MDEIILKAYKDNGFPGNAKLKTILKKKNDVDVSIKAIKDFAQKISNNNWSAIIFPEGTRSKTGHPKPFKTKGLQTLITHMPNALVVPITINNSWKILRYGKFPLGLGVHILFKVHKPLTTDQLNTPKLIKKVEQIIINDIQHESK